MFWLIVSMLSTKIENIHRKLEKSTFHHFLTRIPLPPEGFPLKSSPEATAANVLRIHGRLGLEKPLQDRNVAVLGCPMQRCPALGAAARRNARGEESKFWKLLSLKNLPGLKEHCMFEVF